MIAASTALTSSVASATCNRAEQSISTMSKLALACATSARAALRRAAPVTSRGAAGLEPMTVIASLNGLGLRHSADGCRPLQDLLEALDHLDAG